MKRTVFLLIAIAAIGCTQNPVIPEDRPADPLIGTWCSPSNILALSPGLAVYNRRDTIVYAQWQGERETLVFSRQIDSVTTQIDTLRYRLNGNYLELGGISGEVFRRLTF